MAKNPQKIIMLSDVHMSSAQPIGRTDDAPAECIKKFRWVLRTAAQHEAAILQAGDLFDSSRDWQILNQVAMALREYAVPFYCVYGQHDLYMRSKKARPYTAMGILEAAGLVTVLDHQPQRIGDWAVYGCSYSDTVPAPESAEERNILVRHAPIYTEPLFPGHEYHAAGKSLMALGSYTLILCGDIHRSFFVQDGDGPRAIFNTGPFFRREATEYNFAHTPSFLMMPVAGPDAGVFTFHEIPHSSAAEVLTREHIDEQAARKVLTEFITAIGTHGPLVSANIVDRVAQALESPEVPESVKQLMREVQDAG